MKSIYDGMRLQNPIEEVADLIIEGLDMANPPLTIFKAMAQTLVEAHRVDDLKRVADAMCAVVPATEAIDVSLWYYRQLVTMRMPKRLIEEVGEAPAPHEDQLSVAAQGELLQLRTHALRALGRQAEALALLESAPQHVLDEPSVKQGLGIAHARLMRELGLPAAALGRLEALLGEVDDPQPSLYESLMATLLRYGRYGEAADYGRAAYTGALRDRMNWPVGRFAAQAMWCQVLDGRAPEADLIDVVLGKEQQVDPERDLIAAAGLLTRGIPETDTAHRAFVDRVRTELEPVLDQALVERDVRTATRTLYVSALYDQTYRPEEALDSWLRMLAVLADEFDVAAVDGYLYAAANLITTGQLATARHLLTLALHSTQLGYDSGLGTAALAGGHTAREIELVTSAVFADPGATAADLRLVGELRRSIVSRSARRRSKEPAWRRHGLAGEVVAKIAPRSGRVGVLEWVSDGVDVRALITVVDAAGCVCRLDGSASGHRPAPGCQADAVATVDMEVRARRRPVSTSPSGTPAGPG